MSTSYAKREVHLGYRIAQLLHDRPVGHAGRCLLGHEFNFASRTRSEGAKETALAAMADAEGTDLGTAGHRAGRTTGSFFHAIVHE